MSESRFGSWSVAESAITIEYSLIVIEEIRHAVAEGFQRLSRGGIEVGGVLYGSKDGDVVRITAMRPIACEHARGPAFILSDKDRVELNLQLQEDLQDQRLSGLVAVGWFLSHTRSEVMLTESDLEIYSIFFPQPWQVALVVHPSRGGTMRAGFFVREADGGVKTQSHLEFNFPDRLAGAIPPGPQLRDKPYMGAERRIPILPRGEATAVARDRWPNPAVEPFTPPEPQFLTPPPEPSRKWIWLVVWAATVLVGAVIGLRYLMLHTGSDPVSLAVVEREGQLQIEWNHSSRSVTNATRGSIQIVDGGETRIVALTPKILAGGKIFYVRKSGDVEIRMTVESPDGRQVQEASHFLGMAPSATPPASASASSVVPVSGPAGEEVTALKKQRDELQAEVRRLRTENAAASAKMQQLERTLRILETRLNVDQARGKEP